MSVEDGIFHATTTSTDPQILFDLDVVAADVKMVEIKIHTTGSQRLNFFFITDQNQVWDEFKRSPGYLTNPGDNIIRFDTEKEVSNWKDNIVSLRLDPAEDTGQTFSLDYIRFYGDEIQAVGLQKDMSSCVYGDESGYGWNFTKNTYLDGWQGNQALGSVQAQDGTLNAIIVGKNPILMNRKDIGIDCEEIEGIHIKYKNGTLSSNAKLYFITDETETLSEAQSFSFKVTPLDGNFSQYSIDTGENKNWRGKLLKLIFIPGENLTGSIAIDDIKLQYR